MPRTPYDVNASWDDPFERRTERRVAPRVPARFTVKIGVKLAHKRAPLVGPGIVDEVSSIGLRCRTKHRLAPGQSVQLYISTKAFPPELALPKAFFGQAQVVRATLAEEDVSHVALRFDEALRDDIHLAIFVDHLHSLARTANT
jgi:hypothetical protein